MGEDTGRRRQEGDAILHALRAEIEAIDDAHGPEGDFDDAAVLALLATEYQPSLVVLRAVDAAVQSSASPISVEMRKKLVAAAGAALATRQVWAGPLSPLLYELRVASGKTRAQVAADAGIEPEHLRRLENGLAEVINETANTLASWIKALNAAGEHAMTALARSLGVGETRAYAGVQGSADREQAQRLLNEVRTLLDLPSDDGREVSGD